MRRPVCGQDGQTYSNVCELNCKGSKIECSGRCPCARGINDMGQIPEKKHKTYVETEVDHLPPGPKTYRERAPICACPR